VGWALKICGVRDGADPVGGVANRLPQNTARKSGHRLGQLRAMLTLSSATLTAVILAWNRRLAGVAMIGGGQK